MRIYAAILISLAVASIAAPASAQPTRFKDLVTVEGFRANELTGFGIVVGLDGTGDNAQSPVVRRSLSNMLKRLGVKVSPGDIKAKNVAAVVVTGELSPFARPGTAIDVTVSSMGEAKSLRGGTLIATPLKGPDGKTYALAQGSISLGGFSVEGKSGSSARKNFATVGQIPAGAVIERAAPQTRYRDRVVLLLRRADFTTASRIARAVDRAFGAGLASVRDPGAVLVRIPPQFQRRQIHFISKLEWLQAVPDVPARIVIDERTGTVVVGATVRLGRAAIAHGALTIRISEAQDASQPGVLSGGDTVVTKKTEIDVNEEKGDLKIIDPATTVGDVAAVLNALGAKPRDLVSIFQALKAAGALRAELQIL